MAHIFHTDRHELHGMTVVVETTGSLTYVARFDKEDGGGAHLIDVGIHDPETDSLSKGDYVQRALDFGVTVGQKHLVVPSDQILKVAKLVEYRAQA